MSIFHVVPSLQHINSSSSEEIELFKKLLLFYVIPGFSLMSDSLHLHSLVNDLVLDIVLTVNVGIH